MMDFVLPELGEGIQEGEMIQWLVSEGDQVEIDQPLLEVMTDKATVEVPAPHAGMISSLQGKPGDMLKVGQTLASISGQATSATTEEKPKQATPEVSKPAVSQEVQQNVTTTTSSQKAGAYISAQETHHSSVIPAAPIVRAMAMKEGVSLSAVSGSGPEIGGVKRVLESDLLSFLSSSSSSSSGARAVPTVPATPSVVNDTFSQGTGAVVAGTPIYVPRVDLTAAEQVEERRPVIGLRKAISKAMVKSKFSIPHFTYVDEFECSELVELREKTKVVGKKFGVNVTYLPFIIKALIGALREIPQANSSLVENDDGSMELILKKYYHIGFATATESGLVVPVIKHADRKSILEIARELKELSDKTRAGKATQAELSGSTFTITSMGPKGGKFATPIINYPESGILGVYKILEKPIVKDGQIVVGKTMNLSLSLDHRVIDGAVGADLCNAIIDRLQNPANLMVELA